MQQGLALPACLSRKAQRDPRPGRSSWYRRTSQRAGTSGRQGGGGALGPPERQGTLACAFLRSGFEARGNAQAEAEVLGDDSRFFVLLGLRRKS
jgi:hypothetical protein